MSDSICGAPRQGRFGDPFPCPSRAVGPDGRCSRCSLAAADEEPNPVYSSDEWERREAEVGTPKAIASERIAAMKQDLATTPKAEAPQ